MLSAAYIQHNLIVQQFVKHVFILTQPASGRAVWLFFFTICFVKNRLIDIFRRHAHWAEQLAGYQLGADCPLLLSGHLCPSSTFVPQCWAWEQQRAMALGFLCPLPGQTRPMTLSVRETSFPDTRGVRLWELALQAWDLDCCAAVACIPEQHVWMRFIGTLTWCLDKITQSCT